ncbi:Porin D precursor [compost metagenome]
MGFGIDGFAASAIRLDGGGGKSGANGIDFFKQDSSGHPADTLSRVGTSIKLRYGETLLQYGELRPTLPVLNHDDSRLLPESYTGWMLTSKAVPSMTLTTGHFSGEVRKSATSRDSGRLKQIDVIGGQYDLSPTATFSLYASNVEDRLKRYYVGASKTFLLSSQQSVSLDFNGYQSDIDKDFSDSLGTGTDNKIWSAALTYSIGAHQFMLAHQRSSGDAGYIYGGYQSTGYVGDGGGSIFLSNSYWSDFNAEDERSWQAAYTLDMKEYGVPGLSYRVAYVRGTDIHAEDNVGKEREIFTQLQYVVQNGPMKDFKAKLRGSWLRVSNDVRSYNEDGNEIRLYLDYPVSIF